MKIDHRSPIPGPLTKAAGPIHRPDAPQSFQQALAQALASPNATPSGTPNEGAAAHRTMAHDHRPQPVAIRQEALSSLERLLETMESYQRHLQNPRWNLRALQPELDRLQRVLAETGTAAAELSADGDLRRLVDSGMAAASAEIARFRRGDYC